MSREDWYRRTTWTPDDQREFHGCIRRSRGIDSKAQYIRIQARALLQTGDASLIAAALELLEQSFADYPGTVGHSLTLETAGDCCAALNRIDDAIAYYQRALAREKEFPGVKSNARFSLGKLAVENSRSELYGDVLRGLDDFGDLVFPWHEYMANGIRALVAQSYGDTGLARSYAAAAIEAAVAADSGLGWGRGELGLVKNTDTRMHRELLKIAES